MKRQNLRSSQEQAKLQHASSFCHVQPNQVLLSLWLFQAVPSCIRTRHKTNCMLVCHTVGCQSFTLKSTIQPLSGVALTDLEHSPLSGYLNLEMSADWPSNKQWNIYNNIEQCIMSYINKSCEHCFVNVNCKSPWHQCVANKIIFSISQSLLATIPYVLYTNYSRVLPLFCMIYHRGSQTFLNWDPPSQKAETQQPKIRLCLNSLYSCNSKHFLFIVPVSQCYSNRYTDIDNLNS